MKLFIFVPGYMTSHGCNVQGDTYVDIHKAATDHGFEFTYISIPNNNRGDLGNITMDECLAYVVRQYNMICTKLCPDDTVILTGHSMGGLLVAKMITETCLTSLTRAPDFVRLINPVFGPVLSWAEWVAGTVFSFLPDMVLRILVLPLPIAGQGFLYPESPAYSPAIKQCLCISMLRKTGAIFVVSDSKWDLTPSVTMVDRTSVITCQGDRLTSYESSCAYAKRVCIDIVSLPLAYHEYFEKTVLTALFNQCKK